MVNLVGFGEEMSGKKGARAFEWAEGQKRKKYQ